MYRRNVAGQFIGFVAINAVTRATMTGTTGFTAYTVLDGSAQAPATGSVTDKGNGQYSFAFSQADTNGDDCSILFTMTDMEAVEKTYLTTSVTVGGYSTGQDPATLVLEALQADHVTPATIGDSISRAGIVGIPKNEPLDAFMFYMENIDGTPAGDIVVTAIRSLDGDDFAPFANSPTFVAGGWFSIDLEATDTNADTAAFQFSATGCTLNLMSIVFQ